MGTNILSLFQFALIGGIIIFLQLINSHTIIAIMK